MNNNLFWSDTMEIVLSSNMPSYLELPIGIAFRLAAEIQKHGYKISNFDQIKINSNVFRDRAEIFLESGADLTLLKLIETTMTLNGIAFHRHGSAIDPDHIDVKYDLDNVSVLK